MRLAAMLSVALLIGGCANQGDEAQGQLANGNHLPSTSAVNHLALQISNELVRQNDALLPTQPLLVATPVMLDNLQDTNALGLQLQQGLIAAMHSHQFNLVDINVAQNIRVTPQGDLLLSRDWQQLPTDLPVEHVLVSTMTKTTQGVIVNSRIVNVTNNRVVSASQASYDLAALNSVAKPSEKVYSENGLLYRHRQQGMGKVNIIGEQ
ncbi:FlgO family outer membrane protein [Shewanella waksmanii]|uniref:FlgO family outer membrane protein n=1 Tax=Shewanella waksmanii TaxID=213783 RepID=UPI00373704CB